MSDAKLTVRKENLPTRCEICHQADLFDPETGICTRCEAVSPPTGVGNSLASEPTDAPVWQGRVTLFRRLTLGAVMAGGVLGLIGFGYCSFPNPAHGDPRLPGLRDMILGCFYLIVAGFTLLIATIWGALWWRAKCQHRKAKISTQNSKLKTQNSKRLLFP